MASERGILLHADLGTVALVSVAVVAVSLVLATAIHSRVQTPAPAPVACQPEVKEPTIEITQTFFITVPKVIVKKVYISVPASKPDAQVAPKEEKDPVFEHRKPIIPDSLKQGLLVGLAANQR